MKKIPPALILLLSLDLVFLGIHLATQGQHPLFNLDYEYTFPAGYQALKLLIIGGGIVWRYKDSLLKLLGVGIMYVGVDEWMAIHENTETHLQVLAPNLTTSYLQFLYNLGYRSSTWVILLAPIGVAFLLYLRALLPKLTKTQRTIITQAGGLFALALLLEIFGSRGTLSQDQYFWITTFEETFEMFGASLFALLLLIPRGKKKAS